MASNIRLSTLAEIKVLSLESLIQGTQDTVESIIEGNLSEQLQNISADPQSLFTTVGIARQIRIDEDYGTQNIYAIGEPTRPRIVPNNFTANVTCERIQLDKRNLYDFMSTPEYFYSSTMQELTGRIDGFYYTYMFIRNKEDSNALPSDIYALMPRTSTQTVTNGDVMVSHNVQLTGFKISSKLELIDLITDTLSNVSLESIAEISRGGGGGNQRLTPQ